MAARIQIPAKPKRGEVDRDPRADPAPMETGYRHDDVGHSIKRNVINVFSCRYNGVEVFRADLSSGIAANPYLQFYTVAEASGELEFSWIDDEGRRARSGSRSSSADEARAARLRSLRLRLRAPALAQERAMPLEQLNPVPRSSARTCARCRRTNSPIPACCGWSAARSSGASRRARSSRSCAGCHGDADEHERRGGALSAHRRARAGGSSTSRPHQRNAAPSARARPRLRYESEELLVAHRLRRAPVARHADRREHRRSGARAFRGGRAVLLAAPRADEPLLRALPRRELGQATLSRRPSARATRTPIRSTALEWQTLGSLERRLRACLSGIRAEMLPYGAPSTSTSSCSSPGARRDCRSRRRG